MRSDKQKETSRRNGAKSRGPVTDAGRQRSAQNAGKHYITSQAYLIPGESHEDLEAHFAAYRDRFHPADAVEADLVHSLAFNMWRQRRLWKREADLVGAEIERKEESGFDDTPPEFAASDAWRSLANGPAIALLHREETGLRRSYDRTLKNLMELQSTRPEPSPSDADAVLQNEPDEQLTTCNSSNIQPPTPAPAGVPPVSENGIGTVLPPHQPSASAARAKYHCPQC